MNCKDFMSIRSSMFGDGWKTVFFFGFADLVFLGCVFVLNLCRGQVHRRQDPDQSNPEM